MARRIIATKDNTITSQGTEPLSREVARPIFGENVLAIDYNFAEKGILDDDITFSRASGATQTNSEGKVAFARNNLHAYSRGANSTTYGSLNMEAYDVNYATAPDGTTTATRARPTSATARHEVTVKYDSVANSIYSHSIYVKPLGSITHISFTWAGAGAVKVVFDIVNGTMGSTGPDILGKSITHVGDGWMRMNIVQKASVTQNTLTYLSLGEANSSNSTYSNVAGDGTKGILFWGAQTEQILSAQDEPLELTHTDGAVYQAPRFDYDKDGNSKGLLIEEARTNLVPYSQDFSHSDWIKTNSTIATSGETDPSGGTGAYKMVSDNATEQQYIYDNMSFTSGSNYTISVYVKPSGNDFVRLGLGGGAFGGNTRAFFNLATGQVATTKAQVISAGIEECSNGWFRIHATALATVTASTQAYIFLASADDTDNNTGDGQSGTILFGAQVEQGSFPTSLVPTFGSSATRSGDVVEVTSTNFSRFFKDTEGTFAIDIQMPKGWESSSGWTQFLGASANGSSSHRINFYGRPSQNYLSGHIQSVAEVDVNLSTNSTIALDNGEISRHAIAYKEDDGRYSGDGDVFTVTDTSVTLPVGINRLDIGQYYNGALQMNGWFRRLRYYNKRKSNTAIKKLTDTSFLLDKFKGAKAAHSLRALTDFDKSPVTRIRREYDSFEADYTAAQVSNGELENDFKSEKQTTLPLDVSVEADELVTNGTFDSNTTGWTLQNSATLASENGMLKVTNEASTDHGSARQEVKVKIGSTYKVTADVNFSAGNAADLQFKLGTSAGGSEYFNSGNLTATTLISQTIVATNASLYIQAQNSGGAGTNGYFDNVSVKEVNPIATGFSTRKINSSYTGKAMRCRNQGNVEVEVGFDDNDEISLSSPVTNTSQNLLAYSEDFGEWTANSSGSASLDTSITDPFGGNNSWLVHASGSAVYSGKYLSSITLSDNTYYTVSAYLKKGTSSLTQMLLYNTSSVAEKYLNIAWSVSGVPSTSASGGANNINYEAIGSDGWYRVSFNAEAWASNSAYQVHIQPDRNASSKTVYAFGAQLEETQYESTGTEKITNGDFSDGTTDWSTGNSGTLTVDNGALVVTGDGGSYAAAKRLITTTVGAKYKLTGQGAVKTGSYALRVELRQGSGSWQNLFETTNTAMTSFDVEVVSVDSSWDLRFTVFNSTVTSSESITIDDVSLLEFDPELQTYAQTPVVSNDGSSTTATTLGEFSGKENLLSYSEDFSYYSNDSNYMTVENLTGTTPIGNTYTKLTVNTNASAEKNLYLNQNFAITAGETYVVSAYVRNNSIIDSSNGLNKARFFLQRNGGGTYEGTGVTIPVSSEWQRISVSHTFANNQTGLRAKVLGLTDADQGSIEVIGFQLNTNSLKDYQKTTGTALTGDVNVVNWYDQAGGEDFVNSTAGEQPRIVMGSELVTDSGGKASVYFDGSERINNDTLSGQNRLDSYFIHDTSDTLFAYPSSRNNSTRYGPFAANGSGSSTTSSNYGTPSFYFNGSLQTIGGRDAYHDNATGHKLITHQSASTSAWSQFSIGMGQSADWAFTGKISEMVFFPNMDSSPKRFAIEQNMLRHFDVNLVTNGDFATDSDWTKATGWSIGSGVASCDGSQSSGSSLESSATIAFVAGRQYTVTYTLTISAGSVDARLQGGTAVVGTARTSAGTYTETLTAVSGNNKLRIRGNASFVGSVDNVKVQEYGTSGYVTKLYDQTGNNCHALQSTAANQPQIVSGGDLIKSGNHPAWEYPVSNPQKNLNIQGLGGLSTLDAFFVQDIDTAETTYTYPTAPNSDLHKGFVVQSGSASSAMQYNYGSAVLEVNGTEQSPSSRGDLHGMLDGRILAYHRSGSTTGWDSVNVGHSQAGSNQTTNIENGKFSEMIWYDSDQHSNQSGIESNINTHYNIY